MVHLCSSRIVNKNEVHKNYNGIIPQPRSNTAQTDTISRWEGGNNKLTIKQSNAKTHTTNGKTTVYRASDIIPSHIFQTLVKGGSQCQTAQIRKKHGVKGLIETSSKGQIFEIRKSFTCSVNHITLQSPKRTHNMKSYTLQNEPPRKNSLPTSNFQLPTNIFQCLGLCPGVSWCNCIQPSKMVVFPQTKGITSKNSTETQLQGPRSLSGWLNSAPAAMQNALGTPRGENV